MQIKIYKSALCPRCAYLVHTVKKLQKEFPQLEIQTFDILTDIKEFKNAQIKMIPSIKIGTNIKSWILPKESQIRDFINLHVEK